MALNGKVIERIPSITLNHYTAINQIGNNVNQLTRQINSGEANIFHKKTKKEIQEALTELRDLLDENSAAVRRLIHLK